LSLDTTLEQRLARNISVNPETGCWDWMGTIDKDGYGQVAFGYHKYRAHRAAWRTWRGEIPRGMQVCHHCDNKRCVRPDHLFVGTNADNMADCARKGRAGRKNAPRLRGRYTFNVKDEDE
jgi:hypothetical protein